MKSKNIKNQYIASSVFKVLLTLQFLGSTTFAATLEPPQNLRVGTAIPDQSSQWPDATNTGYKNAPGYPGQLTTFSGTIQSGQTYRFDNFPRGLHIPAGVSNVTFYGRRFASNEVVDANVAVYGDNITFDYSTFEPSAVSSPPVPYEKGYQYGIDQRAAVKVTVNHSDFWGCANCIQFSHSSQTKPFVVKNTWIHDLRYGGGVDHHDGILENYGGQSYMVFDHNRIASDGNTNAIALQGTRGYNNVTVTNNYFSGFGYTVNIGGAGTNNRNVIFTDNTFGNPLSAKLWSAIWVVFRKRQPMEAQ